MIVPQDSAKGIKQGTVPPNSSSDMGAPPPPAYQPPTAGPSAAATAMHPHFHYISSEPRESPRLRFFKAYLVAVLVYLLIAGFFSTAFDPYRYRGYRPGHGGWGEPERPSRSDGTVVSHHCKADWEEFVSAGRPDLTLQSSSSEAAFSMSYPFPIDSGDHGPMIYRGSYSLPTTLESVYFLAKGRHSSGTFTYLDAEAGKDDKITVEVTMRYWDEEVKDSVNLCVLKKEDGNMGFGIFTPADEWRWTPGHRQMVYFDVIVRIPSKTTTKLRSMSSSLPNFSQNLGDFHPKQWDWIDLAGTNGRITVQDGISVSANDLKVHTTNARIIGHFITDSTIVLQTTNGAIEAQVDLINASNNKKATSAALTTTNAHITAAYYLSTVGNGTSDVNEYPGRGGTFDLSSQTTNGALQLTVPLAPISPTINFHASTRNAHANVALYRTFEGPIKLSTSNSGIGAEKAISARDDPSGEGRAPHLEISRLAKGQLEGEFWWGETGKGKGKSVAEVSTSNSRNTFTII